MGYRGLKNQNEILGLCRLQPAATIKIAATNQTGMLFVISWDDCRKVLLGLFLRASVS